MKNILDKINRADEIQAGLELDKTELGTHEVELSLVDDLRKLAQNLQTINSQISDERVKIIGAKNVMNTHIVKSENEIKNLEGNIANYLKQIKDLGIETVPPLIGNIKDLIVQSKNKNKEDLSKYIK